VGSLQVFLTHTLLLLLEHGARLYMFPREGLSVHCLPLAQQHICFLNNQQLVHFKLGSARCVKSRNPYFSAGIPFGSSAEQATAEPSPLRDGHAASIWKLLLHTLSIICKPRAEGNSEGSDSPMPHEKAHFPPRQPHSQKRLIK